MLPRQPVDVVQKMTVSLIAPRGGFLQQVNGLVKMLQSGGVFLFLAQQFTQGGVDDKLNHGIGRREIPGEECCILFQTSPSA